MKLLASDKGITLNLGAVITYNTLAETMETLKQVFDFKQPVVLYGNDVGQVDAAGLQLLLVFLTELKKNNINYSWEEVSPELHRAVKLLGMIKILELPDEIKHGN